MDSARPVPVEPAGSDSGFRVVDVQQRVKAAKLPKKQDPLDHVDSPDKVSQISYQCFKNYPSPLLPPPKMILTTKKRSQF